MREYIHLLNALPGIFRQFFFEFVFGVFGGKPGHDDCVREEDAAVYRPIAGLWQKIKSSVKTLKN